MQTKTKLKGVKERNYIRQWLGGSILALAIFTFGFLVVPYLVAEASAVDVNFSVSWAPASLTLDPDYGNGSISDTDHGNILFGTIIPTSKTADATAATGNVGTLKILKKTIGIESTGSYYTVFLSTSGTSNTLDYDGDSSFFIPPVSSSFTSTPTVFSDYSWGFAVPGVQSTGIDSAPTYASSSVYSSRTNEELTFTNAESVYKNATWSAVPASSAPQQIWKATTENTHGFGGENGDTTNNHFDIYYGIMVNNNVLSGTYANQIVYTALASANAVDSTVSNNILAETNFGADDGTTPISMTLAFDLASSAETSLLNSNNIKVYVVPHYQMLAANYDIETLINNLTEELEEGETLSIPTCSVTDFTIDNNRAALSCNMPLGTAIADNTADGTTEAGKAGRYDFWIKVSPYDYNYITKISDGGNSYREAFAYVGLQSVYKIYEDGAYTTKPYVTEMQQMTTPICDNTNRWGKGAEEDARLYDHLGELRDSEDIATATPLVAEASAGSTIPEDSAVLGLGTFKLIDNRDEKPYLIRRFDDGNCWMVSNLSLDLSSFAGTSSLTTLNTDLSTTRTDLNIDENGVKYWDPRASMLNYAQTIDPSVTTDNYFETASLDLLGIKQHYQFQPKNTYGTVVEDGESVSYEWSTYYYDEDGEKIKGTERRNNVYSQITRMYSNGLAYIGSSAEDSSWTEEHASFYYGNYYNWYAATAESGSYATTSNVGSSICPKGWRLPSGNGSTVDKSWAFLLYRSVGINSGRYTTWQEQLAATNALPFSLQETGYYSSTGAIAFDASYWSTRTGHTTAQNRANRINYRTYISSSANAVKIFGMAIRCVSV